MKIKAGLSKSLIAAVSLGVMSGICFPHMVLAADYTKGLTGQTSDASFLGENIVSSDADGNVTYDFKGANSFNLSNGSTVGINLKSNKKVVINSKTGPLNFNANGKGIVKGINIIDGDNLTINGNVNIQAHNSVGWVAHGISVSIPGNGKGAETHLTINGNVKMRSDDVNNYWGITAKNMHGGGGIAEKYTGARWAPCGIYLQTGNKSTIDINGEVDLAVKGSAIVNDNYYDGSGTITLSGTKINIETPEDKDETYYAIAAYGGDVVVGTRNEAVVNVKGNVIAMKNTNPENTMYYQNGSIRMALMNDKSSWKGVVDNAGKDSAGKVDLYLQNGARWEHEATSKINGMQVETMPAPSNQFYGQYDGVSYINYFAGGRTENASGYIFQKDAAKIDIKNYAGHAIVFYDHVGDGTKASDYKAGDIGIHHADAESGIVLSTDYNNISVNNTQQVADVLNTLAGKLYYYGFVDKERNLTGKVQIASGLTASQANKIVGKIHFNTVTGQGSNTDGGNLTGGEVYTSAMTGSSNRDTEYYDAGVMQNGSYIFSEDTSVRISDEVSDAAIALKNPIDGMFGVGISVDGNLNLDVQAVGNKDRIGISNQSDQSVTISANSIKVNVDSNAKSVGIAATGEDFIPISTMLTSSSTKTKLNMNVNGKSGAVGVLATNGNQISIQGDVAMNVDGTDTSDFKTVGILVDSSKGMNSNKIRIWDEANITVNGTGILAVKGKQKASVELDKGANIVTNAQDTNINYAIATKGGIVKVNNSDLGRQNIVKGNIGLLGSDGEISINFANKNSFFNGVVIHGENTTDKLNLKLANGAVWENDAYGVVENKFQGSVVDNFIGGNDIKNSGIILQKDSHELNFNKYTGNALVVYEHVGSGNNVSDYKAGNTIVSSASAGATLIMTTDNTNINMNDTVAVDKVLNALANKLYYKGYKNNEVNLNGKVQIASGLTSSWVSERIEDIVFDKVTGQGSYGSQQTSVAFDKTITGDIAKDKLYVDTGVLKDGIYSFEKESSIDVKDGGSVINVEKDVKIDSTGKVLNLSVVNAENGKGILQNGSNLVISAQDINLKVESSDVSKPTEGIFVNGTNGQKAVTEINSNLNIETIGGTHSIGVHTSGNSELTINGNLSVKNVAGMARYGYYNRGTIYASGSSKKQETSHIIVNGNVDLQGNGIFVNGNGASITINGGGQINVSGNSANGTFAIGSQSGIINVNMNDKLDAAGEADLVVNGNIGLTQGLKQQGETYKDSVVNIGLNTKASSLHGVIANGVTDNADGFVGKANLYLANGATWINEKYGDLPTNWGGQYTGSILEKLDSGKTEADAGIIIQKDENNIRVNNYSGHSIVVYEHEGKGTSISDYKAGDFVVDHAAKNSGIIVTTNNAGINMNNSNMVAEVLNALAGKLVYNAYVNGEDNIAGKVQISSGLTGSDVSLRIKDITFDKTTGRGTYVKPDASVITNYNTQILEDNYMGDTERRYWQSQYVSDGNRNYTFDTSAIITVEGNQKPGAHQYGFGVIHWAGEGDGVIDMTNHKLTLIADGNKSTNQFRRATGIIAESENLRIKNLKGLDIQIKNSQYNKGIYVIGVPSEGAWDNGKGNAHLMIENDNDVANAVKIRFENCEDVHAGIAVNANSGTAQLDINGLVDIEVGNGGNGIRSDRGTARIGGGKIIAYTNDALYDRSGFVYINSELNRQGRLSATSTERDVEIQGDISVEADKEKSIVGVALNTANSKFVGGVKHIDGAGDVKIILANGALWENHSNAQNFKGSVVDEFTGGKTADAAGYIKQLDKNKLVFTDYSGHAVVMYEHKGDGTQAGHYESGDTLIKKASKNSYITLSTQSEGIDMTSEATVQKVLDTLAGKLVYEGFTKGEDNLNGKVQIASGLTSSAVAQKVGRVEFDKNTGKGSYIAENKQNYSATITGKELPGSVYDKVYTEKDKENTVYDFGKNANVTISAAGVNNMPIKIKDGMATVALKAENGILNFVNESDEFGTISALKDTRDGKLDIDASEVNVKVIANDKNASAKAIWIKADSRNGDGILNVNGDLNIISKAGVLGGNDLASSAYGILAEENAVVTVNGNVTMKDKDGSFGVVGNKLPYTKSAGLVVLEGNNTGKANSGKITVNGGVDIKVDGAALYAQGENGQITINGGGSIEVNKDSQKDNYAAVVDNGSTINLNMNADQTLAGENDLVIKGNIGTIREYSYGPEKDSIINVGLATKESSLNGIVNTNFKEKGQVNMYLSNNATWTNEVYGTASNFKGSVINKFVGGSDYDRAGVILQKDNNNLTINNYNGYGIIIYEHEGDGSRAEDYSAGDTIIKTAAANSEIVLSTDSRDIDVNDKDSVDRVLNILAGKLIYEGFAKGEKSLTGKVQIASGLTASSVAQKVGDITFDEQGKGTYVPEALPEIPDHQTEINFTTTITGNKLKDTEYLYGGVLVENEEGKVNYNFVKDSNINITGTDTAPAVLVRNDVIINATGSTLNVAVNGNAGGTVFGTKQEENKKLSITADRINVNVTNEGGRAEGLHILGLGADTITKTEINGDLFLNSNGVDYTLGAYVAGTGILDVKGNVTMKGEDGAWGVDNGGTSATGYFSISGLYAGSNYGIQKGGTIKIKGDVDLAVNGTGVFANGGGSNITINGGGTILTNKDNDDVHYGLVATSGTVSMNVNKAKTGAENNEVKIYGNIGVNDDAANEYEPVKHSEINLGLNTDQSVLHGVVVKEYSEENLAAGNDGTINLFIGNGATWINEQYGIAHDAFAGSQVDKLVAGKDAAHAAYILQKDDFDLTVDNYSGHSVVVYEHTGDGSKSEDYAAGNTIINNASKNSGIVMSTDNSGIDMQNVAAIENTLNALAGKLLYMNSDKDKNLVGKVQIAGGLTASSVAMQVGDITFGEDHKGGYVTGSMTPGLDPDKPVDPKPPVDPDDHGDIEYGDQETYMMRGARVAMTDAMLSWRDVATDSFERTSELRRGAEDGAWVRLFGGQTTYEGNKTDISGNYYAVQTGFDKKFGNGWDAGLMFDYKDGESDYLLAGEGNYKTYSIGVYGAKNFGDGSYLDLAAKVGQVRNEYTVHNEIGQKLEGEYKAPGYSISAQYGKRILNDNGYFEPQLQLTWAHVNGDSYEAYSGSQVLNIEQDAFNSLVGRLGVEAGQNSKHGKVYARLSLNHEFIGDVDGVYYAKDGGRKNTSFDVANTWTELTLGGNYNLSKCSHFYADVTKTLTGDYKQDWKVNTGFSFTF